MQLTEDKIQAVWEKGRGLQGMDTNEWRQDSCGAWLQRDQYDSEDTEFGWKILNVTAGGGDEINNLQPFHWRNDYDIANGQRHCRVAADRTDLAPGQTVGQPRNADS